MKTHPTREERDLKEQARIVARILGLLDLLNPFSLARVESSCKRRIERKP